MRGCVEEEDKEEKEAETENKDSLHFTVWIKDPVVGEGVGGGRGRSHEGGREEWLESSCTSSKVIGNLREKVTSWSISQ